ncbi:MAG: putative porin [Oleiphilaceae bacterium]|nr:putative porin [Oleiphilaceae bacterium]
MKKTALTLAIAAISATPAMVSAQDYQVEGLLNYQNLDFDRPGVVSRDRGAVEGRFHLLPVRTAGHPLAEAAYLERSDNLFLSYRHEDESHEDKVRVGAEGYVQDFYGRVEVNHVEDFGGGGSNAESSNTGAAVDIGWLPPQLQSLRLTVGGALDSPDHFQEDVLRFGGKWVQSMQAGTALSLEARYDIVDDDNDTTVLDVRGDYFLTNSISVGLGGQRVDNDADDNTAFTFGSEVFLTPLFSAAVDYTLDASFNNIPSVEADILSLTARARF